MEGSGDESDPYSSSESDGSWRSSLRSTFGTEVRASRAASLEWRLLRGYVRRQVKSSSISSSSSLSSSVSSSSTSIRSTAVILARVDVVISVAGVAPVRAVVDAGFTAGSATRDGSEGGEGGWLSPTSGSEEPRVLGSCSPFTFRRFWMGLITCCILAPFTLGSVGGLKRST